MMASLRNPVSPDGRGTGSHPGFDPYRPLHGELLGLPARAWIDRCNRLAEAGGLCSAAGAPLRFAIGSETQDALGYEAAIFHEGRIVCRDEGRGAVHDLHNALVWLTFPAVKATLNRLHVAFAQADDARRPGKTPMQGGHLRARGRVRDLATLLDESGLLWLSCDTRLDAQLQARDWRGLLVENRALVTTRVRPVVIGHGLLEKLAAPYKSMTAHCLICNLARPHATGAAVGRPVHGEAGGSADTASGTAARGMAPDNNAGDSLAVDCMAGDSMAIDSLAVDCMAAACIAAAFAGTSLPKLAPLPILGLPGWDPANVDPSYYDDARVFRAPAKTAWRPLDVARLHSG